MLIEIFIILVFLAAGAIHFARFVENQYLLILFAGLILVMASFGAFQGIQLPSGITTTFTPNSYNATSSVQVIDRVTISDNFTKVIGLMFSGFAFYLIIISPYLTSATVDDVINAR